MIEGKDWCILMKSATMLPFLEELVQYDNDPVLILDTSCKIESINQKAAELLNLAVEVGKPLSMDKLSQSRWYSFLKRIRQESFSFSSFKIKNKDSSFKEIKVLGMFIQKENLVFLKILSDDEKKKFQVSSRGFLNDLPYGIIFFKEDQIFEINSQAVELLKIDVEKGLNLSLESFLSKYHDYKNNKLQFLSDLKKYGQATLEISHLNNEEEVYLTLNCKYNYYLDMYVMTVIDNTENVKLKQNMRDLERLSNMGRMSASITHEIKNLVTSLKGFVELLKDNTTEEGKKYLHVMESEMERMESILSELLYLSKPSKAIEEKVSLLQILKEVVQIMQPHAYSNNVIIQLNSEDNCNSTILGNVNQLKQVFINLVKNAIEVMKKGGTITIELKDVHNKIQVSVQDEGIGIPEENLSKLFTPFFTTKEQGTGLGLCLVKKVVDEHQGKIVVKSTVGVGSTFILEFPNYTEGYTKIYYNDSQLKKWLTTQEVNSLPVV